MGKMGDQIPSPENICFRAYPDKDIDKGHPCEDKKNRCRGRKAGHEK
jgi:hypothetical protein